MPPLLWSVPGQGRFILPAVTDLPQDAPGSAALEETWAKVVARWDDDEAHRKFISLAASLSQLPEAGKRYREARDRAPSPEYRKVAESQLDRLFVTAMAVMQAARTPPVEKKQTLRWVAFALMMLMILAATYLMQWGRDVAASP